MPDLSSIRCLSMLAILSAAGCSQEPNIPYAGSGEGSVSDDPYTQSKIPGVFMPQAGGNAQPVSAAGAPHVVLASNAAFSSYLVDASGRALYMFANDSPGANSSACTAGCLDKWPVFDAKDIAVGAGLTATDFTRFQRTEGVWQTAFKGRPLYRFATDAAGGVSGDGVGGRWFVARDYQVFSAAKMDLTPAGAVMPAPYMTNRLGRTIYVFMNDTAGTTSKAPSSACVDACLDGWPVWSAPDMLESMVLPSSMRVADFGQFERSVAGATLKQLTYRGYPLYLHTPDVAAGATSGHMTGAWRALDPALFMGATP